MVKTLSALTCLLGAALVAWMGAGFLHTSPLALLVTLAIAVFYSIACVELWRFQRETAALQAALTGIQAGAVELAPWLATVPAGLRTAVSLRIQGEPVALPAPLLTPYITGLLVMLGLLGTFVGMMVTLQGTVTALEGSTELSAIRAGLAAPIKGLAMAFGTSVAGVGASAALGFISTLSRRQRLAAGRLLDSASAFKCHSRAHYQEQMLAHAGAQAEQLPALVTTIEQALRDSIAAHGQWASDTLKPAIDSTMAGVTSAVADISLELRGAVTSMQAQAEASLQRDLSLLAEQRSLLAELTATAAALREDATAQRASLEALAQDSGRVLADTSARFENRVVTESQRLAEVADHFACGAVELSSLGEALGTATQQFQDAGAGLRETLQHMDAVLNSTVQRSDEQMGYYVEQAREIIDHSVLAQQQLIEQMRQLSRA
jgi:hypothetical protein